MVPSRRNASNLILETAEVEGLGAKGLCLKDPDRGVLEIYQNPRLNHKQVKESLGKDKAKKVLTIGLSLGLRTFHHPS